ncbi:hypothetical protein B0I35DRAFT_473858 [Stachybotrys elegans]|uniref:Mitochondrial cytochrome c oxidase assembly factor n=1 Tax=Stachybotrys elegans TaxID=80388 RepID=A0A8K0T2Z9_9HYPO|nr:hypothetical protein B0I35DRAFT_473858 [Stachybotrys elegans]
MPGVNLEVFKFGVYLMFPIGFMYYFGVNLDNRFSVPDFWPKPDECAKLPRDREELVAEYKKMVEAQKRRQERLQAAAQRRPEDQE